jgi:MYXO-CTERM domain-containing protein
MMMLPDGNMVPVDAGAPDAGGGAVGAEGGGCGCRAAGSTPGNRGGSLALLALGLGLVRRRRRNA